MIPLQEYVKARVDKDDELKRIFIDCRFCKKPLLRVMDIDLVFEDIERRVVIHGMYCEEFKKNV